MQERRDSGLEVYRKGGIRDGRDSELRGIQERKDAGKEEYRTGVIRDWRDSGLEGYRTRGKQERSF